MFEAVSLPNEVHRLVELDPAAFAEVVSTDAKKLRQAPPLSHPAVVERWEEQIGSLVAGLRNRFDRLIGGASSLPPTARNAAIRQELLRAGVDRAYAEARRLAARIDVGAFEVRLALFVRQAAYQQFRASCLAAAAARVSEAEPALCRLVATVVADHETTCVHASAANPCRDCVGPLAARVARLRDAVEDTTRQPVDDISPSSVPVSAPVDHATPDSFLCTAALDGIDSIDNDQAHVVVVTGARRRSDTGAFGYAWVTEDGEMRTGVEDAVSTLDAQVHAICQAVLDQEDRAPVHVVCRDPGAAGLVQQVIRSRRRPDPDDVAFTARTRSLLAALTTVRQHVSVSVDRCPDPHLGTTVVGRLAALALDAAQWRESLEELRTEADRYAEMLTAAVGSPRLGPDDADDHAWWDEDADPETRRLAWRITVRRLHLAGGWCPLPEPPPVGLHDGRRLQLRLDHHTPDDPMARPAQNVTLRRRGGEWELADITWPSDVHPGTLVAFGWQIDGFVVTGRTFPLDRPERVDEVEFRHRYDVRVVTREHAPGADQDREVPELSVHSWVLRTLRRLGHLAVDGSATLAEAALVRDCVELGMPNRFVDQTSSAVADLVRTGRVHRVVGSVDADGRPWHPARPGHVCTELLMYMPSHYTPDVSPARDATSFGGGPRRDHVVAGFIRRLPPGAQASVEQLDRHRDAVRAFEVVDRELPEGFTYVRRHRRGHSRLTR
ncbi:hypothetical protein GCM10007977_079420 [Dactylosporangium sucinum]|uniref:Uncharacterized protein n=1 Tax=Dactylosporangium sucinum TaxID=1424081 RepID=A0A917U8G7_9ACTN|nr:hypothetical protein GCM10007977_079420 [Dactylosporangium sucinum]